MTEKAKETKLEAIVSNHLKQMGHSPASRASLVPILARRLQPLIDDGCPSVTEALRLLLKDREQDEAASLHGSGFHEA